MMMGMVMIGAIATNQSAVTLDNVTPIARLTAEFEVIVVPTDSEYQTLRDLIADFTADPARSPGRAAPPAAPTTSWSA